MKPGLSISERKAIRDRYRADAIARAERAGMTLRCEYLQYDMDHPNHQLCKGEEPGNGGCLCKHHDLDGRK